MKLKHTLILVLTLLMTTLINYKSIAQSRYENIGSYYLRSGWTDTYIVFKDEKRKDTLFAEKAKTFQSRFQFKKNSKNEFIITTPYSKRMDVIKNADGSYSLSLIRGQKEAKWVFVKRTNSSLGLKHVETGMFLEVSSKYKLGLSKELGMRGIWGVEKVGVRQRRNVSNEAMQISFRGGEPRTTFYLSTSEGGGVSLSKITYGRYTNWTVKREGDEYYIQSQFTGHEYLSAPANAKEGSLVVLSKTKTANSGWQIENLDGVFGCFRNSQNGLRLVMSKTGQAILSNNYGECNLMTADKDQRNYFLNNYAKNKDYSGSFSSNNNQQSFTNNTNNNNSSNGSSSNVNGLNVKTVEYNGGKFVNTNGKTWIEYSNNNGSFTFTEKNRDQWSVYLFDSKRNMNIQLDLWKKEIYIRNGGNKSKLYSITKSSKGVNGTNSTSSLPTGTFRLSNQFQKGSLINGPSEVHDLAYNHYSPDNNAARWKLKSMGNGYYRLQNQKSYQYIGNWGSRKSNTGLIKTKSPKDGALWKPEKQSDGTYKFKNKVSGYYLAMRTDGSRKVVQLEGNSRATRWKIIE